MYWDIAAEARVGDNSDQAGGLSEITLDCANTVGHKVWDSNLQDGFDSGDVGVYFAANAGAPGSASWMVSGGSPGTLSGPKAFGVIDSVEIIASAQAGSSVSWSNLTITFFKDGEPVQTITIPKECNPIGEPFEQVLQVVPDSDDNTGVVITGSLRLQNAAAGLPNSYDMIAAIHVFTTG